MNLMQSILFSWFDLLGYVLISCKLFRVKITGKMYFYISIFSIITGTISYWAEGSYAVILIGILLFVFLLGIFRNSIVRTINVYIISTILLSILQLLIILITKNIQDFFVVGIISQSVSLILVLLIYFKVPLDIFMDFVLSKNKTFLYLQLSLFFLTFLLLIFWHVSKDQFLNNIGVIAVLSIAIIIINFVILNRGLNNKIQEEELRIYQIYNPIVEELIDELRARQHEFDNQLQAMHMLITTEDTKKDVREYLNQMNESTVLGDLIKIENKLVAGLLYSKKKQAIDQGIEFEIRQKLYYIHGKMKEFELVEILGILLDNAFETNVDNNKVILEMKKVEDNNVIKVMNKHSYLPKKVMEGLFIKGNTTKGKARGYGLYRLKSICKMCDASLLVDNVMIKEENYVMFEVSFSAM
ncbi:GHKL domain-containing protein [Alkalibaculum sp. M08DMB]|uniref:GHKL domain-containing protein n=1 Tax=Alkalibaculum sporogenes TaxID=2655001 RepID=A0A6A7K541_9FIRM|nr:GHKL domain-containing protein [Alkalibaculum sporogenes]MPW24518.1 GHKL domain-containing protein [Alkalibaculum sporogenes]